MKVLIFGGTGLVGSALVRVLSLAGHRVEAPSHRDCDVAGTPPSVAWLAGFDAAINAAFVKDPARLATAQAVNVDFPHSLARRCREAGVAMIQISTDGVFSGAAGPYAETDRPDPDDLYSRQKAASEPADCLVLRTSVIGPECARFTSLLCWFLTQEERCQGYTNHLWNGLTSLELARAVACLLEAGLTARRVQHLHGEDVSKHQLLSRIAAAFGKTIEVAPAEAPVARDRRLRSAHGEVLVACRIQPLERQLAELAQVADPAGHWRD